MSGITPLIDTLLPQVLGKRVDIPTPREATQPVSPVATADAVRAVHSDSRLNAAVDAGKLQALTQQPRGGDINAAARGAGQRSADNQLPSAPFAKAAEISLSNTAQTLATLLSRPAQGPAIIQPSLPLAMPQQLTTETLAANLQTSIRDSGLFYESHLSSWLTGKMPSEQLSREPQMLLYRQYLAAVAAAQSGKAQQSATSNPAAKESLSEAEGGLHNQTQLSAQSSSLLAQSEAMQGLVRQQLELLANPVLHWSGEVWSGVVMALFIQIPGVLQEQAGQQEESANNSSSGEEPWSAELALQLENLGPLKVKVSVLAEKKLAIWLQSSRVEVFNQLQSGLTELRQRLESTGFGDVELHTSLAEQDDE